MSFIISRHGHSYMVAIPLEPSNCHLRFGNSPKSPPMTAPMKQPCHSGCEPTRCCRPPVAREYSSHALDNPYNSNSWSARDTSNRLATSTRCRIFWQPAHPSHPPRYSPRGTKCQFVATKLLQSPKSFHEYHATVLANKRRTFPIC